MRLQGEGAFDPRFGKGGVPGAPGAFDPGVLGGPASPPLAVLGGPNTTGSPVGYNPLNQVQTGIVPGDPMSQIGNQGAIAHGQHTTDSFVDGVPKYWPGSHDPRQHNPLVDPAGNFIPGTAPKDSDIPLGYETNQSSNLPTSITQSSTAFPVGNMNPLIAQGQTNLLNPFQIQENMNKVDQVREGTYEGGKGGMVDKIFKNQSDKNSQLRQLMEQAGM